MHRLRRRCDDDDYGDDDCGDGDDDDDNNNNNTDDDVNPNRQNPMHSTPNTKLQTSELSKPLCLLQRRDVPQTCHTFQGWGGGGGCTAGLRRAR